MSDDATLPPEEVARRRRWFDDYCRVLDEESVVKGPEPGRRFTCPCCRYATLTQRGGFEICSVCFWEVDGQDDHDATVIRGGPNGVLSLEQARRNYVEFGACEERWKGRVRPPLPEENRNDG